MASTTRIRTVGMAVVMAGTIGLAGTEPEAFAASVPHAPVITLMLVVDDRAGIPANILEEAKEDATRVFRNLDVEIIWLERGDARLENAVVNPSVRTVHLLPRAITDRMDVPGHVLGIASGARVALVFYGRIEDLSQTHDDKNIACLLGHVIAHEMGHLLLPSKAHASSGIMQAGLNTKLAAQGGLFFSASQAHQIRTRIAVDATTP